MRLRTGAMAGAAAVIAAVCFATPRAQQIDPAVTPSPAAATTAPSAPATPAASPSSGASPGQPSTPSPTPSPTPAPITVQPASAQVPVGETQTLKVTNAGGTITAVASPAGLVDVGIDQASQQITLAGKAPGAATLTVSDQRGLSVAVPVRIAYYAGTAAPSVAIRITGDPASASFIRDEAFHAALGTVTLRPGAQVAASADLISFHTALAQDDVADVPVPILLQGDQYFTLDTVTHVFVTNLAAPKITPDSLMVSDFPERLTENGVLFAADLKKAQPSRFLYFHYNPAAQPDRRVVLRLQNLSREPAIVQFINGAGGPDRNEMEAGHAATAAFLKNLVQGQGRIVLIPGSGTIELDQLSLPADSIACEITQLRVLNGASVHMTLFAQTASSSPDEPIANEELLSGDHPHARGIYNIPEFHHSTLWRTNDEFLELPIGQIPLPNTLKGEALAGDYGVLQSFVIKVENPTSSPAPVALYEEPRGGRATGTFLIDGVLVQAHGVAAFSRYKLRQYVVPARGFVRVTIETIPDSGSSYPVRLIFAPDDGSVAPGAPGSPVY